MSKYEILGGGFLVIVSYCLFFCFNCGLVFPFVVSFVLSIFYIVFLTGRLPIYFYKNNERDLDCISRGAILACILYSLSCVIVFISWFFPWLSYQHGKLISRIAILSGIIVVYCSMLYGLIGRIFFSVTKEKFLKCLIGYIRFCLVIMSNLIIIPWVIYTYSVSYRGGRLVREEIVDGMNWYLTEFNTENGEYTKKVREEDFNSSIEYIIHYDVYPIRISRIDTISRRNR